MSLHDSLSNVQPQIFPDGPSTPPTLDPAACPRCGALDTPDVRRGSGPHAWQARCAHCGGFLRWVSRHSHDERVHRREQFRRAATQKLPATVAQLEYLAALGDTQEPPSTMWEASGRIEALVRERQGR